MQRYTQAATCRDTRRRLHAGIHAGGYMQRYTQAAWTPVPLTTASVRYLL